jgi:hypothetical protein
VHRQKNSSLSPELTQAQKDEAETSLRVVEILSEFGGIDKILKDIKKKSMKRKFNYLVCC